MAMAVASMTGQASDPATMAQWAAEHGYWARQSGSYLSIVEGTADAHGLETESLPNATPQDVLNALMSGKVLVALMNNLKERSATEIIALGLSMFEHITTTMDIDTVLDIAVGVLGSDFKDVESFRLPIADSYKQETRNEESMFYDCDWATNARELQSFIYS